MGDVVRMAGTGGPQKRPIVQWRAGTVTMVASLFEDFLGKNHKCSPSPLNSIVELSVDLRSCFDERFAGKRLGVNYFNPVHPRTSIASGGFGKDFSVDIVVVRGFLLTFHCIRVLSQGTDCSSFLHVN